MRTVAKSLLALLIVVLVIAAGSLFMRYGFQRTPREGTLVRPDEGDSVRNNDNPFSPPQ